MTRETSIEAYNHIKNNGLLSKRKMQVYDYLYKNGPATGMDVTDALSNGKDHGSYSTRLSELREAGVVKECGKVKSNHSTHEVILWDVTSKKDPIKPVKKKTKVQLLNQEIEELKSEVNRLSKKLKDNGISDIRKEEDLCDILF